MFGEEEEKTPEATKVAPEATPEPPEPQENIEQNDTSDEQLYKKQNIGLGGKKRSRKNKKNGGRKSKKSKKGGKKSKKSRKGGRKSKKSKK